MLNLSTDGLEMTDKAVFQMKVTPWGSRVGAPTGAPW